MNQRVKIVLALALLALPVEAARRKSQKVPRVVHAQLVGQPERRPEEPLQPVLPLPEVVTLETLPVCPQAVLAFRNAGRTPLTLQVGENSPQTVQPGTVYRTCAEDNIVSWQVTAPDMPGNKDRPGKKAGWRYGGRLDVTGVRLREETLIEPGATLELVNATGETQRIWLDGRNVGQLESGKSRSFGPVTSGQHRALGQGKISRRKDAKQVRVDAGGAATLTWQPPPTWTQIRNREMESAHVVVDGVAFGDVPPGGEVRVLGLGGGKHQAVLTFFPSGQQKRLEVLASPAGSPPGQSPEIEITARNRTGEILDIPLGLRTWGTEMDVGAVVHARVPRRTFGATLIGRESGLKYHLDVHANQKTDELHWEITRPQALLRVRNETGVAVHVELPNHASMEVGVAEVKAVRVPAGRMSLLAQANLRTWKRGMTVPAGREVLWKIAAPLTALIAASGYAEPLMIRLDGGAPLRLLPGKSVRLKAKPGEHTVEARAPRTGTAAKVTLRLQDGERQTVQLKPPTGTLRLTAGTRPLQVFVRGTQVAEAQPGEPLTVPVAAGQVQAEVRDDQGRSSNFLGLVAPTQQVELMIPAADLSALELGWEGTMPAQLTIDGGPELAVQPGGTLRVDGIARGPHLLAITSAGLNWRRWVQVDGRQAVARVKLRVGK